MNDRRAVVARFAPLLLVALLAAAVLVPSVVGLQLASRDAAAAQGMTDALDGLPEEPTLIVAFDPDLGTYAEVRPTVRTALADLLARGARLAFVSLTPEGRALALAELERLDRLEANPRQIADLGFVPGAEAALVSLAGDLATEGAPAALLLDRMAGAADLPEVSMVLVIGGNDMSPRAWVEQVAPRTTGLGIVAIAPTILLPELQPYLASGQLEALLATPRDGAAYRAGVSLGPLERIVEPVEPPILAILVGLLAALAVLGQAVGGRVGVVLRAARSRETS